MTNGNTDWERLRRCIALGRTLASEHPEITDYYRARMTYSQIVDMLDYEKGYEEQGHSRGFLEEAIAWAIKGNDDEELGVDYVGLLTEKEQRAIRNNGIVPFRFYRMTHLCVLRDSVVKLL